MHPVNILHTLSLHNYSISNNAVHFFKLFFNNLHKNHLNKILFEFSESHKSEYPYVNFLSKNMQFNLTDSHVQKYLNENNYAQYRIIYKKNPIKKSSTAYFYEKHIKADDLRSIKNDNFDDYINIVLLNNRFENWSDFQILYEAVRRDESYILKKYLQINFI